MSSLNMTALQASLCRRCLFTRAQQAGYLSACKHGTVQRTSAAAREVVSSTAVAAEEPHASPAVNGARSPQAPTFQEAVSRLQQFWSSRGCIVWLPHNTEVGAGTMNPATFLRVLGPEPWSVCYTEPSVRPDDSRYGLNPNRVQRHTQYQVILKPDPGNPQELYLQSLEALGIDTSMHDVRFVEDNWESPALGAWGLGWEVWLDGMEVTQFTYFQQSGSQALDVPAVEITYGLERILMALQGVKHFKDIRYNNSVSYGELFLQNEHEMSVYNLEEADTSVLRQHFALYEQEALKLLDKRLPIPAYDHILKLSHFFNLLDARGAVGFTERQDNFARMRNLARRVSEVFQERRAELDFPLGQVPPVPVPESSDGNKSGSVTTLEGAADFVLEIGTEELPPLEVTSAVDQLQERVESLLADRSLNHSGVNVQGTPRRLVVQITQLAAMQKVTSEERRGPPRKRAYDEAGEPTKALVGFCKSNGADINNVYFQADKKGTEYCYVTAEVGGEGASAVLQVALPDIINRLSFGRSMRWMPHSDVSFSRPVRWLLALHGDVPVSVTLGSLQSSQQTRLLRQSKPPTAEVSSAAEYRQVLASAGIVLGQDERRAQIWSAVQDAAKAVGGTVPESEELLEEVANLVEAPTVLCGEFSTDFLRLPAELLVKTMRKHQRYFPVCSAGAGELINSFITVANGAVDVDVVRRGNEDVLRARFEDASFFYDEDLKRPLVSYLPTLKGTMFHNELGSLFDKSSREAGLVAPVADLLGLSAAAETAQQAAELAKADLATAVVNEMTSLAGVMGCHYAQKEGQPKEVADAIFEGVLPRSANDILPSSEAGIIVSVVDKLDSLVGLAAAGCLPRSGADRYGLRRITYGLLQTLIGNKVRTSLTKLVTTAAAVQPIDASDAMQQEIVEFATRRLEQYILDQGVPPEVTRAVLHERSDDASLAVQSAIDLGQEVQADAESLLPQVLTALSRPTRLVRGEQDEAKGEVDSSLFTSDDEKKLWATLQAVREQIEPGMGVGAWLKAVSVLVEPVDSFFTNVMVMDKDESVRCNRLALSRAVAEVSNGVVELAELPGF